MEENLNETIHKFEYEGNDYEIDWLKDATCMPGEMVCDIFRIMADGWDCVGQIVARKDWGKKTIEAEAIKEINEN